MSATVVPALWRLSAAELAAAYRAGETTPDAVLTATLDRIAEVNPRVNAIITLDADGARASASASTARWRAGEARGALDGVPITAKDNILVGGLRATWGSTLYADHVPDHDEAPVARLREAGAVILGKTNVPEFTVQGITDNALFGPTRNPWDLALTPGGSSGGAVAAVATGLGAIALCTDGGGSIRRPAGHTGLVGFKPSRHMVPRGEGFPAILHDFEVAGPIARSVADVILVMETIAGPAWRRQAAHSDAPLRVLFVPTFGKAPVDPEIAASVAEVAAGFARQGHQVETARIFEEAEPIAAIWPVISQTGVAWLLERFKDRATAVGPALIEMARAGAAFRSTDYLGALDTIARVQRRFDDLFATFDLLLIPTAAAMPWPATELYPPVIAGEKVGPRGHAVFTAFANALGLPAMSLPCRPAANGLPIGFQLCAAHGRDVFLLGVARRWSEREGKSHQWPVMG